MRKIRVFGPWGIETAEDVMRELSTSLASRGLPTDGKVEGGDGDVFVLDFLTSDDRVNPVLLVQSLGYDAEIAPPG